MAEENNKNNEELFPEESMKEVVGAGVFYGRSKSKVNPKMRPYILANRGGMEIINLYKTLESLNTVLEFVKNKMKSGGFALLIGTQPAAIDISEMAKEFGFPLVTTRWLGGTLTNFKVISQRVQYFKKLKDDMKSGAFAKYTKKERVRIEGEIEKLQELVGGLEALAKMPDFVVVIDPKLHTTAIREANRMKIPVVAFANVDADPDVLDYFVVGNCKARKSVSWFLGKIKGAIEEGKKAAVLEPAPQPTEGKKETAIV